MKAIGFDEHLPISNPRSLFDFTAPLPILGEHDLLVKVSAVYVYPVDTYVR